MSSHVGLRRPPDYDGDDLMNIEEPGSIGPSESRDNVRTRTSRLMAAGRGTLIDLSPWVR
jgi:hypothetical protein